MTEKDPFIKSNTESQVRKLSQRQTEALTRAVIARAPVLRLTAKALALNDEGYAAQGDDLIAEWTPLRRGLAYVFGGSIVTFVVRAGHWNVRVAFDPKSGRARAVSIRDSQAPRVD